MLTEKIISELKTKLSQEKTRLEEEIKKLGQVVDFGDDVDHGEEEADEREEIENNQAVANEFRARLLNIESALRKMNAGGYGKCERCGGEIELELLRVNPESRMCRACKH